MFVKLFALVALLMSLSSYATFTPQVNSITCSGGITRIIPKKLLMFSANISAASYHGIFLDHKSGSAYTPSGSNKFCIVSGWSSAAGYLWRVVQGDTDGTSGNYDMAAGPSGAIYDSQRTSGPTNSPGPIYNNTGSSNAGLVAQCVQFEISNGKYAYAYAPGGSGNVHVIGYEATSCDY